MHYKMITEAAISGGLIAPKSDTPWTYMQAALSQDIRRREARGETPRFAQAGRGFFRLNVTPTSAEAAVALWNSHVKERLRAHLLEIEPSVLEHLVGDLLERLGFDDIEVTRRSQDGGVDVRAVLTLGGLSKVVTAIQVKRWKRNVPIETVRELRGALNPSEQGLVITTSGFTRDAIVEADVPGRLPIGLLDGSMFVELLAEQGLGLIRRPIAMLEIDEQLMSGLLPDAGGLRQPASTATGDAASARERFVLFRLPSAGSTRLDALLMLLSLVEAPVAIESSVAALMQSFPRITRSDVAIRHLRVLVALGFADIQGNSIFLTPEGREFLSTHDPAILRSALLRRIYGAEELLRVLRETKPAKADILGLLQGANVSRITPTQATRLVEWFLLSGLARKAGERIVATGDA